MAPSPEKKKKEKEKEEQSPELPGELLVLCLARVPRLYYPKLTLVSKSVRSLIASPDFYQTRSDLGRVDTCLYVCLQFSPDFSPRWYTLCRRPDKALNNHIITNKKKKNKKVEKESSGHVLVAIPTPDSISSNRSAIVSVGSKIYSIGGYKGWRPLSTVWILDCKTHTWKQGPNMKGKRRFPSASVIDGKIYVGGGGDEDLTGTFRSIEIFDPRTKTWELKPCRYSDSGRNLRMELDWRGLSTSASIEGRFHLMLGDEGLTYDPEEDNWEFLGYSMGECWNRSSDCVINNVLYSYDEGAVVWYDTKTKEWEKLKGLKGLPKFGKNGIVQLVEYGGKMAILWEKFAPYSGCKEKRIWCSVIELENRNGTEIWGKVEWCDIVLTVPKTYVLDHAVSVTF